MHAARTAEQALRLTISRPTQQYICRACRAQAARQFSTSQHLLAEEPFYKRIQRSLFGSKESKEAEKSREDKQKRRLEELSVRDDDEGAEVKTDKHGRQYEVAAIVDPTVNKDYVQSTTWEGLESVGSVDWVKQRADQGEQYVGFMPKKRIELSNGQWEVLLHHIAVEALVLQKAGRDAQQVCWPRVQGNTWTQTKSAIIAPSGGGGVSVSFEQSESEQQILETIPETLSGTQRSNDGVSYAEVQRAVAEAATIKHKGFATPSWMDVSLQDPSLKLAIMKRTLQLTGKRVPDPAISSSTTLADLYNALKTREKPKKLAQTPQLQRLSIDAPNVAVHSKRQTPIDKEISVGRWKVIEEELLRRDLPVTGSRYQGARVGV